MGWKAFAIIINKPRQVDNEILLNELCFEGITKIKDEQFDVAINPDDNTVYIGSYKDNLLVCTPEIPMLFFEDYETQAEHAVNRLFPNSEICSFVLHSVVNLWGYSVIKNGKKIRTRAGSANDGTFIEEGNPLDEEKDLLSKSRLDDSGKRIYVFDDSPDEVFSEDQVGENFVFSICKRYFDEELDSADDSLFETILSGYRYEKISETMLNKNKQEINTIVCGKPWWKFW
ncbi:DUF6928 family protein [Flavobacterium sp. UBA4197]|uniref:DUF6928 family protein n=1 Tax=Flavobacterium sp. UBA4197 TaxID=1946546 RepID=UPI00257B8E27|nr:hypothetical protein [Flavobacterium sp. UBA4197]